MPHARKAQHTEEQAWEPLRYYKWFWKDWRANRKVQRMSWQARGLYRELLDELWSEGVIPDDLGKLAEICGCTLEEMTLRWPEIAPCWVRIEGGYTNAKMEAQRTAKDSERAEKARFGRSGAIVTNSLTRASQASAGEPPASAGEFPASAEAFPAHADIEEERREEERREEKEQEHGEAQLRRSSPSPAVTGRTLTRQQQAELVYEAYPHKIGKAAALKSIEKAMSAVKKAGETDPAGYLLARIRGWIAKRERDQAAGAFIPEYPNPATWFNQQRYDDPDNAPRPVVMFEAVDPATFWEEERLEACA